MGGQKRCAEDDGHHAKQKKHKTDSYVRCAGDDKYHLSAFQSDVYQHKKRVSFLDQLLEAEERAFNAELLNAETITEGMLLLGCVTEIKPTFLEMSLPGFLSGKVKIRNISNPFMNRLRNFTKDVGVEKPTHSFIQTGMIFPCKILKIFEDSFKKRLSLELSINPVDINADLKPSLLYLKMVLYVSVSSIEDHGCVVDVGNKHIKGFLPKKYYQGHRNGFKIGEVIPTIVRKITSDKTLARIQLSPLDFAKPFPKIPDEDVKLKTIIPGMKILGDVIDIKHPFIYINHQCFDVCASILSIGPSYATIKIGQKVCGTVLYVHPVTQVIYISLNLKSTSDYFGFRKYAFVKNLKYFSSYKKFAYYIIKDGTLGVFHVKDLPKSLSNEKISKACVLNFHYMDNLVQLSANSSLLEKKIIFPEDVQIGDVYEAVVSKHVDEGMFVKICPGLSGFVRTFHMSDVFVTKPEALHPVGSKVKCRVLFTNGKDKLYLTCKESFLKLEDHYILSSYENAQKGQFYKGVIVQKTENYVLVLFFNNVKGIVLSPYVPKGSILFEGQTVLCEVLYCNSLRNKLRLSIEEIDDMNPNDNELKPGDLVTKAIIQSVKGHQLNIMFNRTKGRVHITELGCTSENLYPLKDFMKGEKIQVFIIGEYMKKRNNYLQVSHKNYIPFKECSLGLPPYTVNHEFSPGQQIMGFVKEVQDVSMLLWLTPYHIGRLHYLHISKNLKTILLLRHHLKVGLSMKVSVLENNGSNVILTKIDEVLPQPGKNIIGLVEVSSSAGGLVLRLPFGYHGSVAVTDLTDFYNQVPVLFEKFRKFKFLKCHVLEVNHESKFCQLSLRKSRMYGISNVSGAQFCPEISESDIKVGNFIKGFVKSISDSGVIVTLGRNLNGKIPIHTCSFSCQLCEVSRNIIHKYPVGSIIETTVEEGFKDGGLCTLKVNTTENLKNNECNRLDVEENLSWNE